MDTIVLGMIVLGLTEAVKKAFGVSSRYIPLVAIALTFLMIVIYYFISHVPISWEDVQNGFIIALTSVGLYSTVKNTVR